MLDFPPVFLCLFRNQLRARPADESLDNFLTGIVEIDLPIE